MKWVKHVLAEQNLRSLGIKFDVEQNIPFNMIDLEEGKRRQVRLKVNPDTAVGYGMKMLGDTAWHMTILQKEKRRYWPWSGNQRLSGYSMVVNDISQYIDAYVVEIHDPVTSGLSR